MVLDIYIRYRATTWDIIVYDEYRQQGIGVGSLVDEHQLTEAQKIKKFF